MFGYTSGMTAKQWLFMEGPMYIFVLIWMSCNVILFVVTYYKFQSNKFAYLREMVEDGLPVARGAAAVLNLNCALILLPVCRNLVNFFRGQFESKRSIRRLFDKNILFHKWCAYVICVASAIHIGAHIFNAHNLTLDTATYDNTDGMTDLEVLWTTLPGLTGVGITFSLILMVTTASPQIRRSYFELFWYTHHLFVVFYVCLAFHGYSGFVRRQTNFDQVPFRDNTKCTPRGESGCRSFSELGIPPGSCANTTNDPNHDSPGAFCCPCESVIVETQRGGPATWMWIIGPLILYILERLYRLYMSQTRKLAILKVVRHKDSVPVMEVQFQKIPTKAGQYVFINCSKVAMLEWHPFTLTSCPELDYVSLHIRLVGDWTSSFAEACGFYDDGQTRASRLPSIAIDGPFGTSSEDLYRYPVAICVGAGIGVTPFASLIQALYFRKSNPANYPRFKTEKVYFYWICPGFDAWGWFANLLMDMEEKLAELGETSFFTIRVFMTRGWSNDDAARIMLQENQDGDSIIRDVATGRCLKHKMNFGRPMWDKEFESIGDAHAGRNVGVFFCGPKVLSQQLHRQCNKMTVQFSEKGTKFFYNKENF